LTGETQGINISHGEKREKGKSGSAEAQVLMEESELRKDSLTVLK